MEEGSVKRKLSQSDVSSKRFKDSGIENENSLEDSPSVVPSAGTIKKIILRNFMCHESLEIALSHGVNFINGRNGTGKSAILTALVVGLGGRASDTNRGFSLKEFIKTNESSAIIKIVINNDGYNAFQPEIYGDEIIVQRIINVHSGSQYKIMSSDGSVKSTKHEDLQRIMSALNLQVDNPVAILTQDTARNFLHNTRPEDKYLFFLKATRLEHIESVYRRVQHSLIVSRETQTYRSKVLEDVTTKKNELEKRLKNLHSVEETRDRKDVVLNELHWAHVKREESVMEEKEAAVQEQDKLCKDIKMDISKLEDKAKLIAENKKEFERKSQELLQESNLFNSKSAELKTATEAMNNKCKDKSVEIDFKTEEISKLKNDIETLDKQIVKMQAKLDKEVPKDKENIERSIIKLTKEGEEVDALVKTHKHHLGQLETALAHDCESVQSLEEELRAMKAKIAKTKARLASLDGQDESLLRLFGDHVIALNKAIKQAYERKMFSEMPRGPIGSYIKVKDKSWAPAVESIIGGDILRSYYVNSHQDRKILYKLMNQVMGSGRSLPSVTASKFTNKVYDYRRNAVQCPGHSSVLDMLEVSDPLVTNCLIDLLGVESTLLVESPREAREMMKCEKNVPFNCKKVVTKTGDTLFPDPNYRIYSGDDRTEAKFLQVSVDEAKRRLNAEISDCSKWALNTASQKVEVEKRVELHKIEIRKSRDLLMQLSSRKIAIANERRELQQTEINDADNIDFWFGERDSMKPQLEKAEEQLGILKVQFNNMKTAYKGLAEDFAKSKEVVKEKSREIDSLVSKSNYFDSKLMQINSNLKSALKKKNECVKNLAVLVSQLSKQKEVVEKREADAIKLASERIETDRSVAEIEDEVKDLMNKIERVERSEGNPKEIGEQYNAAKRKCEELTMKIRLLDNCIKKLKLMLRHRREIYSKCLQTLVTRVKMVFQTLINRRRFQGGIVVDHKAGTLDIKVTLRNPSSPKKLLKAGTKRGTGSVPNSDPKSLSGGERSFSTVAYIIALWEAVELPFYALDEFDVFMDNINREWTLILLKDHAKEKKECQFVFLTPQPINSLSDTEGVSIFSLKPHEAQTKAIH